MIAPGDARALLEERARALARPATPARRDEEALLVGFAVGDETCAIEAGRVHGVFRLHDLAPLPGAGPADAGLTAWRGELLRIVDPRALLGLPAGGLDDRVWVVAIGRARPALGLLTGPVTTLSAGPGVRAPGPGVAAERRFVRGIVDPAVLVLDAEAVLEAHG